MAQLIRSFVALRWRLLRGSLRGKGTERVGVIISTIASVLVGVGVGLAIAVSGRTVADDENLFVLFCVVAALGRPRRQRRGRRDAAGGSAGDRRRAVVGS